MNLQLLKQQSRNQAETIPKRHNSTPLVTLIVIPSCILSVEILPIAARTCSEPKKRTILERLCNSSL